MDQREIFNIMKNRFMFMGTVEGTIPHVRPMKPYIDDENNIWLISHVDTKKIREIEDNSKVELCTLGDENEVLRIAGQLESEDHFSKNILDDIKTKMFVSIPQLQGFFQGPEDKSIAIYHLKVSEIIFRHSENEVKSELNFHKG
ncbi:pyridoxamine 5'-phosphate oxidase family protein [Pelosinus sp. sgz500959]|uniref:pyridoxamine 5'-phosphate oxidase family protein n=1 Tax=Pelosinus sp. sgz500959 TaxID=3242472 RepID=UPI00366D88E3